MPCERLDKDVEMMKKAEINTVRIAESTWSTCEPQEGVFGLFSCGAGDGCHGKSRDPRNHRHATYAVPAWMVKSHPDVLATTVKGRGIYGSRQIMDITHPVYRYYGERVIRKLMEHTAHRKVSLGSSWIMRRNIMERQGRTSRRNFVKYLREKFQGNLDEMTGSSALTTGATD